PISDVVHQHFTELLHTFGDDVTRLRMGTGTAYSCQQVQQLLALAEPCLHQCLDALPWGHRRLRCGDHGKFLPKNFAVISWTKKRERQVPAATIGRRRRPRLLSRRRVLASGHQQRGIRLFFYNERTFIYRLPGRGEWTGRRYERTRQLASQALSHGQATGNASAVNRPVRPSASDEKAPARSPYSNAREVPMAWATMP